MQRLFPWLLLAALPVLAHLPPLSGWIRYDPIYVVSGLSQGSWTTNGALPGLPWIDPNAGVTTEALGGFAAHEWLAGRIPWWNPYSGTGLPLIAEGQTPALFLPFTLLLAIPHGLLLLRLTMMAIAGWSSYALLRRMALSPWPALTGAALFELNGTFAWLSHGPIMPVAFLPMILLGLEVSRTGFSLAAVAGTAWSLLAGFPETACLDLLLCAAWGAVRLAQAPDRLAYARRAAGAVAAGILIASPCWWPFLQALPDDFLGTHAGPVQSGFRALNLPLMLFPGIFGAPLSAPGATHEAWIRAGGYTDLVLVTLAIPALLRTGQERALRWMLAAWIAITAARAFKLPLAVALFSAVPLLRQANPHLYAAPAWSMACCILAAFTLQRWRDGRHGAWKTLLIPPAILAVPSVCLAWPEMRLLWSASPYYFVAVTIALIAPASTLCAIAICVARPFGAARARLFTVAAIFNALMLFTLPQLAGTRGRSLDTGSVAFLQAHARTGRVLSLGPLVPNYGALFGIPQIGDNALPVPRLWVDYVRAQFDPASNGVDVGSGALQTEQALRDTLPRYEEAGVAFAVTPPGTAALSAIPGATRVHAGTAMDVWQLPHPAPYVSAPSCTIGAPTRTRAELNCTAPSTLRRLELASPGWTVSVSGRNTPLSGAPLFQAVPVPQGRSTVIFSYAPPGIGWTEAASAAGWAAALIGYAAARRRPASLI